MKHRNTSLILVFIMAIASFACLSVSLTYSYIVKSDAGGVQNITTDDLEALVTHQSIDLGIVALSDEDGLAQSEMGNITITKDNNYTVLYSINISFDSDLGDYSQSDLLPPEYIKLALFQYNSDGTTLPSTPLAGPVRMADLPVFSVDSTNPYKTVYILGISYFNAGSDNSKYALKVWADEDTPEDYEGKIVKLDATIHQETMISKSLYNLSGTVKNGSTSVSGATVELQNGNHSTTTDSSGNFTLSNVPEGTYNLKIINGGNVAETTVHIQSGSAISITKLTPSLASGSHYLTNEALTYYTTPYKIKNANSLTSSTMTSANITTMPSSYVITGLKSIGVLDITNIKIDIGSSTLITRS